MKIIYIVEQKIDNIGRYRRWYAPEFWYDLGYIFGYIAQFAIGFGIGWAPKCALVALGIL